ncbi:hypothetical protein [Williamsia sterculiae]|uniref:DUF1453 domain-containing protein n=1 Tax=Williamsia sterculiae TaxID=1344003 RepID=A0A1N7FCZ2_9NOCA|nr:hypothetical protein [Williamsia sterculiae]SIR98221.1 hypothetical protein SAMN05445060_1946 [Williamsia sterculiae]
MLFNVILGVVIVGLIVARQMKPRAVASSLRGPIIITVIGLVSAAQFVDHHHVSPAGQAILVVSTLIGFAIAAVRGYTIRIWRDDRGTLMSRGTWLTLVLWVVGIGVHVGIDLLGDQGLGQSTLVLYLGVVLFAQMLVVQMRGRALVEKHNGSAKGCAPNSMSSARDLFQR